MTISFGTIIKFQSAKVAGNDPKPKFHITISLSDRAFLFINSSGFDDSFEITRTDWAEMPNEFSFISCNAVIRYDVEVLKAIKPEVCGKISDECMSRLRKHLASCEVMEAQDLNYLISIIDKNLN